MSAEGDPSEALCRARYARVQEQMVNRGVELLLLSRQANAYYASGARRVQVAGSSGGVPWVVVRAGEAHPSVFTTDLDGLPPWIAERGLPLRWNPSTLVAEIAGFGARRIAYDGLSPRFTELLEAALPDVEWQDGEALMAEATAIKTAEEIDRVANAVRAAEGAVDAALDEFRAGADENAMRAAAMSTAINAGASFLAREVGCRMSADRKRVEVEVAVIRNGYQGESIATAPAGHWTSFARSIVESCCPGALEEDVCRGGDDIAIRSIGTGAERVLWPLRVGMVLAITAERESVRASIVVAVEESGPRLLSRIRGGES